MLVSIIIIFCVILVGFNLVARKYRNPYSLIFLFGKKGSGKSCYMVNEMLKHLKHGWNVYTDIQDINIPGVRIIKSSTELSNFAPEANSAIFLDEVGISFDNRGFKSFPTGLRDFFKLQRKYRCKVYMNSQAFDVDKKIRDVTDSMILMSNIANCIAVLRPIRRTVTLTAPSGDSESRIADQLKFERIWHWKFYWMPEYFKYFDSFNVPARPEMPYELVTVVDDIKQLVAVNPNDLEERVYD